MKWIYSLLCSPSAFHTYEKIIRIELTLQRRKKSVVCWLAVYELVNEAEGDMIVKRFRLSLAILISSGQASQREYYYDNEC